MRLSIEVRSVAPGEGHSRRSHRISPRQVRAWYIVVFCSFNLLVLITIIEMLAVLSGSGSKMAKPLESRDIEEL
jgi:hypothetical protein